MMAKRLLGCWLAMAISCCAFSCHGAAGEASGEAAAGDSFAGVSPGIVDGPTARRLVAAGAKVVDVRTQAEFDAGHVPGAVLIPHDEMSRRAAEIGPTSTPVVVYCKGGKRTLVAIAALREKGFRRLFDLQKYENWVSSEP